MTDTKNRVTDQNCISICQTDAERLRLQGLYLAIARKYTTSTEARTPPRELLLSPELKNGMSLIFEKLCTSEQGILNFAADRFFNPNETRRITNCFGAHINITDTYIDDIFRTDDDPEISWLRDFRLCARHFAKINSSPKVLPRLELLSLGLQLYLIRN